MSKWLKSVTLSEAEYISLLQEGNTKRVFFMNPGEQQKVSLRFERKLLDSVVERLGAEGDIIYRPDGPDHFVVNADI